MKKNYALILLMALCMSVTSASAQEFSRPTTKAGYPVDGKTYVMVSAYTTTNYSHRTSWDGAVYFANDVDFEITAQDNTDGTWSFYTGDEENKTYMVMNNGSGNLNFNSSEQTYWYVIPGDIKNYVKLQPGEGNSEPSQPYYLHLNKGGDYFVISEPVNGGGWYPDFAGGPMPNPDPDGEDEYLVDETGRYMMADHTSEHWAFIAKEDFPDYKARYDVYNAINQLAEYDYDEYKTGFQATYYAVLAIYNGEWEPDVEGQTMVEMVNKKIAFFNRLEEAYVMDADAKLEAAIETAQAAFDTVTSVEDVQAALDALNEAIFEFESGSGDYTGLIQNPSFEDLSSQGGSPTSSVAGVPTGWNAYINGTQVFTADQVRNAGVTAWHGINADCNGAGKDGTYGFGLWTGGVPQYEISQTIEGLECGTYIVSAGLMVGANGNGSRRTTQRIFGNFNASYFASQSEYNEEKLDLGEVREFAGLIEPVTDTELQPITVRAYVYDGTLTFGLRTDGNIEAAYREMGNSAGGDGWFKLDNFHIQKEGYIGADAANVANTLLGLFKAYQNQDMQATLTEEIQALVKTYTEKTADSPKEDINAMIVSLMGNFELIDRVKSSIAAYESLREAIDHGYDVLPDYQFNVGAEEYEEMHETAETGYLQGEYDEAQIAEIIANLEAKLEEVILAGLAVGDYLNVIKNPSFEDLSAQNNTSSGGPQNPPVGWTLKLNGTVVESVDQYSAAGASLAWCAINNGDNIDEVDEMGNRWTTQYTDGTHLWGIWAENIPEVELSQTIEGLPAGTYELSCDMVVQHDWSGYCITTQRIFANGFIQMFSTEETYADGLNETEDMTAAKKMDAWHPEAEYKYMNYAGWQADSEVSYGSTSCPYPMNLAFGVAEDGVAYIGFRTNNVALDGTPHPHNGAGWFKLDNFKLYYASTEIPTGICLPEISGQATQIQSRQYFTTDGRQIAQPQRGITIVRNVMSDGSVKAVKVMK